jgi:hypothetical protein
MSRYSFAVLCSIILFSHSQSPGNERKFSYVYESSVLPTGVRELEVWNTLRAGKDAYFRALDQRMEFEVGVTDHLMTAFYINLESTAADSNGTAPGGILQTEHNVSFSSEWKYKLLDRVADPVGMSLYGELKLGMNVTELEGKMIFDKQVGNFLFAANVVAANEWETSLINGATETASEMEVELDAGLSYALDKNFSCGIESFVRNIYLDGALHHSALYAGPVISYTADQWWATLTIMPQTAGFAGTASGQLNLDEFERVQSRLLFSFHL